MAADSPDFTLKLASTPHELRAAQRLRYAVFVEELGADGPDVDHALALESDRFDPHAQHLLLIDRAESANDGVVGCYRLLTQDGAARAGGFYSAGEFDLDVILQANRPLMELGRSCVHPDYRGGTAMFELWSGLARYVQECGIEILFGVASFHGADVAPLKQPLSFLHHSYLAPEPLRVRAHGAGARTMALLTPDQVDRRAALMQIPALIKGYLRLGGAVGEGAWIDRAFNTVDVCMVMDISRIEPRHRAIYGARTLAP